jgi:hypothetical protein
MKIACYMVRHFLHIGRAIGAEHIMMARINRFKTYCATEREHKDPEDLMEHSKPEKVQDFIDEFPENTDAHSHTLSVRMSTYQTKATTLCLARQAAQTTASATKSWPAQPMGKRNTRLITRVSLKTLKEAVLQ